MALHASTFTDQMRALEGALIQQVVKETPGNIEIVPSRPLVPDRWLLASALQKGIRRGLFVDAADAALVLLGVDPEYAWRRLRVIAIEDVGLGDIETVASVLAIAGKRTIRQTLGEQRLFVSLVTALCVAPKDRTACDLLCWIEFSPAVAAFRSELLDAPERWEVLALNDCAPVWQRVVAVQLIAGLTVRTRGGYRAITRVDTPTWWRVVEALGLRPLVALSSLKGAGTESLNAMLPFAQLLRDASNTAPLRTCERGIKTPPRIGGFIAPAFCKHTRVGLHALRLFLVRDTKFRDQLIHAGATDKIKALGLLLFQIETGILDRFEDYAPEVRIESERAELAYYGICDDGDAAALRMMLKQRLPALDDARRTAWAAYLSAIPNKGLPS